MPTRLTNLPHPYRIINHSISGETTQGGASRFQTSLDQTDPAIVILALGANDGLRGLSVESMHMHLQRMIDMAHARQTRVVLVGMRLPSNYGPAYTDMFHQQYKKLAEKNNISCVPWLRQG